MKELFVVYEYEKISFLVALKTPQKSEKSSGETSRLRSESLALSQFSEISFLVQLANKVLKSQDFRTFLRLCGLNRRCLNCCPASCEQLEGLHMLLAVFPGDFRIP